MTDELQGKVLAKLFVYDTNCIASILLVLTARQRNLVAFCMTCSKHYLLVSDGAGKILFE